MASISIFTFDHDPPRVSSPWSTPPSGSQSKRPIPQDSGSDPACPQSDTGAAASNISAIDYSTITKLEAEPQKGPTEYKLHLLLRRRRSFARSSTDSKRHVSGSLRRMESPGPSSGSRSVSDSGQPNSPTPLAVIQSRQHRLEKLTTQLFWRLQQSSPHHMTSSTPLVVPQFPDEAQLSASAVSQRLLPGLEESKGALYEIGVADDGTFVGLAEDEMDESLNNLRAMAASLGCRVDVLRMVQVGECEWLEHDGTSQPKVITGKLWVSEAFVQPGRRLLDHDDVQNDANSGDLPNYATDGSSLSASAEELQHTTQQLRVSLTGATMSGKSSLLGSLSTSTLDNGRGKSRLSLLKHRHEIASGMTSSVTQELIGYRDVVGDNGSKDSSQVVSYASGDVSEWLDIHASAEGGRLVFLSDSAGHPRFRRTTVRGLVGWDPHWTLLCISADNTEESFLKSPDTLGAPAADVDLSQTHLQLCLNLDLPLVVAITKYDLATKQGLRQTLSKLLSAIKDAGRKPCIVPTASEPFSEADLNVVSADDLQRVGPIVKMLESDPLAVVPIILTSAVKGTGITTLHAFLRELPVPCLPKPPSDTPRTLFYIEDVYSNMTNAVEGSVVLGGHMRYGTLRIGADILLGPYPTDMPSDDSDSGSGRAPTPPQRPPPALPTSRSFPGALRKGQSSLRSVMSASDRHTEWRSMRVTSLRNLRLPVRSLHAGQAGTLGVAPVDASIAGPAVVRIRKGMVLADGEPGAHRVVGVRFAGRMAEAVGGLGVGSGVVVYIASVRASAKVVSVAVETGESDAGHGGKGPGGHESEDTAFGFGFEDEGDVENGNVRVPIKTVVVVFQFIASREFVEKNARVLVLPGGGPGLYGGTERGEKGVAALEGFVGRVVEGY